MPKSAIRPKVSVADDFHAGARSHTDKLLEAFGERMDVLLARVDKKSGILLNETATAINEAVPRRRVVMPPYYATHHLARRR